MKKLLAIVLALVLVFALVACSPKADDTTGGGTAAGTDVHVFYYSYADTYISNVRAALDGKLDAAGVTYQDYDGAADQTTQTEQIQTAVTKGAKALVVNIVDTASDDAANNIVTIAKDAGIPVIFFNREVSDAVITSYESTLFIGTNAPEAGHLQGAMVGDFLLANYDAVDLNGDGVISYVLFKGQNGNPEAEARSQFGVEDADAKLTAAGKPALAFYDASNTDKFLVDMKGEWSAAAANEYMSVALTSYSEANNNMIELVLCNNDGMAEGAISALQTAGYNTGEEGSIAIPVFGVDATPAAQELIKAGKMTGTVKQDADAMAECIAFIISNATAGKPVMEGTDSYNVDATAAKIRIPYAPFLG